MTYKDIKVGKSLNPSTGEDWWKVSTLVSLDEGENPDDIFKAVKERIEGWLPNPFERHISVETYSRGYGPPQPAKLNPDKAVRATYEKAVKSENEVMIKNLEAIYDFKL